MFLCEEFAKDGLEIDALTIKSFPIIERRNSSSASVDFLEMQIDELYHQFKLEYKASAKAKGYKRPQAFRMEARRVFRKKYRDPLMELIIEFYIESYNPDLEFDREVLETLGFRPCSSCNGQDENEEEEFPMGEPGDPVDDCRRRMSEIYELLACAGTFGLMNTMDDPLKNIENIKEASPGQYYGLHKFSRKLQVVIKTDKGTWLYAELPRDRDGNIIFTEQYELWVGRRRNLSEAISGKEEKELVLLPVKD